jgi:hypothetical protein
MLSLYFNFFAIGINHYVQHVYAGSYVVDLVIDADGEKIKIQTQHKDTDRAFQQFVKDSINLGKTLSEAPIE